MMSQICSADTCFSNHTTEVDGRSVKFYPLPNDEKLKGQWKTICKAICTNIATNNYLFRLCELHFEKRNFDKDMQLKSNVVPTIFDFPRKRKAERLFPISTKNVDSPAKIKKSENNDINNYKKENMPKSPSDKILTSTPLPTKVGVQKTSSLQPQNLNNPLSSVAKLAVNHSPYRLLIQIDKILSKPGPKSKKFLLSSCLEKKSQDAKNIQENLNEYVEAFQEIANESIQENLTISDEDRFTDSNHPIVVELSQSSPEKSDQKSLKKSDIHLKKLDRNHFNKADQKNINKSSENTLNKANESNISQSSLSISSNIIQDKLVQKNAAQSSLRKEVVEQLESLLQPPKKLTLCKKGCQLQSIIFNNRPAFRCGTCNNIYLPQPINEINKSAKVSLYPQIQENLKCDICFSKFDDKAEYTKHMRQHTYLNPSTPFQCHMCPLVFKTKYNTRQHISKVHVIGKIMKNQQSKISVELQCKLCDSTFKDEENLRSHMKSHKENDNPVLPMAELEPVQFLCTVCSEEFTTLAEINAHTTVHSKTNEDHKCNVCNQIFPNDQILSDHLREHVARAYRCHLCPKAFVDNSALQMHLKNHV